MTARARAAQPVDGQRDRENSPLDVTTHRTWSDLKLPRPTMIDGLVVDA
jgi:hypothetical protein